MNKDEILQAIKEGLESSIPPVVERVVNGRIVKLQGTLEQHMETSQQHYAETKARLDELQPVAEGVSTIKSLNKFFKWVGLPAFGAFIYWLFK